MHKFTSILLVTMLLFTLVPFGFAQDSNDTILNKAVGNDDFSTLVSAVAAAGLESDLMSEDVEYTLFAPTDEAFDNLLKQLDMTPNELMADAELLRTVLLYHIVEGSVLSSDIDAAFTNSSVTFMPTLQGADIEVMTDEESLFVNNARVISIDTEASNGVIHAIDNVLLPPGSVLEIIDSRATAEMEPEFTYFMQAVEAAELTDDLSDPDMTYTLFVPTDAAFEAAAESLSMTPEELLGNADFLTEIVLNHVLPQKMYSPDLVMLLGENDGATTLDSMLNDALLDARLNADGIAIEDAQIIDADILASNGVIHVIDTVLLPETA